MNENERSQEQMSDSGEPKHEEGAPIEDPSFGHTEAEEHRAQPAYEQLHSFQPQPYAVQYQEPTQPVQQVGQSMQQPQQARYSQYSAAYQGQPYSESFGTSGSQQSQYQPSPYQPYATPSNQSAMQSGQYRQPQVQQPAYQYQPVQQQPGLQTPMAQSQYSQSQQSQPRSTQQPQYMQSQYATSQQSQPQYAQMQQPQAQYGQQYVQSQLSLQPQPQSQYMQPAQQPVATSASNAAWYHVDPARQAAMAAWLGKARKQFSSVGFALVLVVAVWYFLSTLGTLITSWLGVSKDLPMWAQLLLGNGPLYVIAIPLSLLIFRKLPKVKRKKSTMSVGMFVTVMLVSFPISIVGSWIGDFLSGLLSNNRAQNGIAELIEGLDPISLLLFTVIVAPIFEEWLFRRLLIDRVQQYGEKTAILFSAVTFGLFHGNLFQFFYAFGFGLLLAYVYVRTGKLRYTIAMHVTFNFMNGFLGQMVLLPMSDSAMSAIESGSSEELLRMLATSSHGMELAPLLIYVAFTWICLIAGIALMIANRKKLVFHTAPEELPRGTRAKTVLGNPGVIIYIVLSVMLMVAALF